ncbi:MAG: hypothetical protein FWG71_09370 [Synergistaceae bacterium]|nr:hypothetical protein [Synergistaceae bacterium]
MKKFIFNLGILFTAVLLLAGVAVAAIVPNGFDPESWHVNDGLLYMADGKQFEGAEVVEDLIEGGKIYWLAVDPEAGGTNEGLYKGWKGGIYFFGGDGKFISMLEREGAQMSYVQFCPDGQQFVLSSGTYADREYLLYEFDGFELKKSFGGIGGAWIDPFRFAYSIIDASKGPRHENADFPGRLSVVVYDSAVDLFTIAAEATATEDFMMNSVDAENGELVIMKLTVKDEGDWGDEGKLEIENIRVPLPAAG